MATVSSRSARAVSFCMVGGLERAMYNAGAWEDEKLGMAARDLLLEAVPLRSRPDYLHVWNDRQRRTQAQVLACYDRAIAKIGERGGWVMELLQLLKDAREILTPDGAWTTGTVARDILGTPKNANAPQAISWCMVGALDRAASCNKNTLCGTYEQAITALRMTIPANKRPHWGVSPWNDRQGRTQAQVLACYDRAIAGLEKQRKGAR